MIMNFSKSNTSIWRLASRLCAPKLNFNDKCSIRLSTLASMQTMTSINRHMLTQTRNIFVNSMSSIYSTSKNDNAAKLESTTSANVSLLSQSWQKIDPYYRLMRIDRPVGSWLLFWPCSWGIALSTAPGCIPNLCLLAQFGLAAFIMRGAGCTINDMWDRGIDQKVERTKGRPLASGQISQLDALMFLSAQLSGGLIMLLQLNWPSIIFGTCSMSLVIAYPLMKRITHWPQLVLGVAFNWGTILGWCATQGSIDWAVCLPLFASGVCWTIVYDTIYAHQDRVDDVIVGVKSTALRFGENTKVWLSSFSTAMITGLLTTGYMCDQSLPYYGAVGIVAAHLARQLYTVNIDDPSDCAEKFISNNQVGLIIFAGIVLGTYFKKSNDNVTSNNSTSSALINIAPDNMHVT